MNIIETIEANNAIYNRIMSNPTLAAAADFHFRNWNDLFEKEADFKGNAYTSAKRELRYAHMETWIEDMLRTFARVTYTVGEDGVEWIGGEKVEMSSSLVKIYTSESVRLTLMFFLAIAGQDGNAQAAEKLKPLVPHTSEKCVEVLSEKKFFNLFPEGCKELKNPAEGINILSLLIN